MIDVPRVVRFCSKNKMSFEQFMLCYLIHLYRKEERTGERIYPEDTKSPNSVHSKILEYVESVRPWTDNEIDYLIEKGYLIDKSPKKDRYPDNFEVTEKFSKLIFTSFENFETFWETFPGMITNFKDARLPKIPLKAVDKEEIEVLFYKKIANPVTFQRLITATAWAKSKGLISVNIKNWLIGEVWKEYEKQMKEGSAIEGSVIL